MELLERCRAICEQQPGTIAFADCLDNRVLEAAIRLKKEKLAEPVLVQSPFRVKDKLRESKIFSSGLTVVDHTSNALLEKNMIDFLAIRQKRKKPISSEAGQRAMNCSLAASAMMVRRGDVEIGISGNLSSTADVLRAGLSILPKKRGINTISSFFFMISPDGKKQYIFSDCAVVPEPTSDTLADIAIASADKARNLLNQEPRVAMLSFSTRGSSSHPRAGMIREAVEKIRSRASDIIVDGEMQFDAAVSPRVAALKTPGSLVEGKANVLIFPSLEAGNIGYKIAQRLGGYTAVGPFLQGFENGWHDLSRGCSVKDIIKVALIGICLERGKLLA